MSGLVIRYWNARSISVYSNIDTLAIEKTMRLDDYK